MVKKSFTLAEVLITLGIIGVVAAMTMPALINKANDRAAIAQLKKTYSILSQALLLAKNEHEDFIYWPYVDYDMNSTTEIYNYIKPHLKILRECQNQSGCWAQVKNLNNENEHSEAGMGDSVYNFTLADGVNISMNLYSSEGDRTKFGVTEDPLPIFLGFWVDVNGDKKPNQLGYDVFLFILTRKGLVPAGMNVADENLDCVKNVDGKNGYMCSSRIFNTGKTNL